MKKLKRLGAELELERAERQAGTEKVPPPGALLSELHNIPFTVGEKVMDTVTGQEVEVLGAGIRNVESETTGA